MLAVLLMMGVAVGIAYPYIRNYMASRQPVLAADGELAAEAVVAEPSRAPLREELCPQCSRMNPPGAIRCFECGGEMAVTNFRKLFAGADQDDLLREGLQAGGLLLTMLLAMALANFLPIGGKLLLLVLTIAALGYRFTRVISN